MNSALWEHRTRCGWECLTYSILNTLVKPSPSHFWIVFSVLLNWLLRTLCRIQVHPIGAVHISVEPVHMISGWLRAPGFSVSFCFIYVAHATMEDLEVDGSTILNMSNTWSTETNPYSFHNWYSWDLRSANMEHVVVKDFWPLPYWTPW